MNRNIKHSLLIISVIVTLTGCMGGSGPSPAHTATLAGDYKLAALESDKDKDLKSNLDESNQLVTLYAGNSYLYSNDYEESLKRLDEAERIIKFHNEEILLGSAGDLIAQLMLNDAMIDYHATMTDGIMVNTYKAINYMALGKTGEARIEFNRAIDRQRRAKETYSELIAKQKEAVKEKEAQEQKRLAYQNKNQTKSRKPNPNGEVSLDVSKTVNNPDIQSIISRKYPSLKQFEAYPDFVNPFTNYMAGIFFATQKDYPKSASLLKEVYGMSPNSTAVRDDLAMVENILDGKKAKVNNVWVIYANGLAPKKEQYKINIPLFLFSSKVNYTGIALPKMKKQSLATPNLSVFNQNKLVSTTQSFASMDRVILTEFDYTYTNVVSRAVFSALMKTYFQYQMQTNFGSYAGLASSIYQVLTTRADTRTWGNLPKEYQVSRINMPSDQKIQIQVATQMIKIDLKGSNNAIIFVRKPTLSSKASYSVIKL